MLFDDPIRMVFVAFLLMLASAVQSAAGFGYALVATPVIVWLGAPLPETIALVITCAFVQSALGAHHLRASVPWKSVAAIVIVRLLAICLGILVLARLAEMEIGLVKFIVGCVVLVLVGIQGFNGKESKKRLHWSWGALAASASGFLAGAVGMGGPPLVLWVVAHDWSSQRVRGFLFSVFICCIPLVLTFLYLKFGGPIIRAILMGLLFSPLVILGARLGLMVGDRVPIKILRLVVYGLLIGLSLNSMAPFLLERVSSGSL